MHPTALTNARHFFDCYFPYLPAGGPAKVVEVGSLDVNGSIRKACPPGTEYLGLDFAPGKGVDVVLEDPYSLPLESESVDIVLSSSCFEHSEMFWLVFLEVMRVLKPHGLFYLNAPSNGGFHRHPVDCWRFYPDSGRALVSWAQRNGVDARLLESYTSLQVGDLWNDFVAVFVRTAGCAVRYPVRIVDTKTDFINGLTDREADFLRFSAMPEDQKKLGVIGQIVSNKHKVL